MCRLCDSINNCSMCESMVAKRWFSLKVLFNIINIDIIACGF